jgi:hypothetical protein
MEEEIFWIWMGSERGLTNQALQRKTAKAMFRFQNLKPNFT